jgi:hypothetical protein
MQDERVLQDPQVQKILAKSANAKTTREALDAHLLLERFLLGKYSTLEDPQKRGKLTRMLSDAEAKDRAVKAWEEDKVSFVESVFSRSESKKLTGEAKDKAKAKTAHLLKEAMAGELSTQRMKQAELDYRIMNEPKYDVQATGKWIKVGTAKANTPRLEPERVIIMHREYTFQPGLNRNVPKVFAEKYEQILNSRAETAEREEAMGKGPDQNSVRGIPANQLEAKLMQIDRKYGVKRQLPS